MRSSLTLAIGIEVKYVPNDPNRERGYLITVRHRLRPKS